MLIQLPNGKTVNMSIEQYLALDDADIKYMISTNCGSVASSPWCGSVLKQVKRSTLMKEEFIEEEEGKEVDREDELEEEVTFEDSSEGNAEYRDEEDDPTYRDDED